MRARNNRRKTPERRLVVPKIKVNWRALLVPPLFFGLVSAIVLGGREIANQPIEKLQIDGEFQRVQPLEIEAALEAELGRGFLALDLAAVRRRLQALDWIDEVQLGRRWPATLAVRVTEHVAAARWGDFGLLNVRGELFTEDTRYQLPELPRLAGPPGTEQEVAHLYLELRGRLVEAQLQLDTLRMDERGAVQFTLSGGQEIRLGRQEVAERMARFFEVVAPSLRFDEVSYVDLRYTNGFAIGWVPSIEQNRPTDRELLTSG